MGSFLQPVYKTGWGEGIRELALRKKTTQGAMPELKLEVLDQLPK